jgi:predicted DNA-binding transcriptional regulator AlpA
MEDFQLIKKNKIMENELKEFLNEFKELKNELISLIKNPPMQKIDVEKFVGVEKIAELLELKRSGVYSLCRKTELKFPFYKIDGKIIFRISEVEKWVLTNRVRLAEIKLEKKRKEAEKALDKVFNSL